MNWASHAIAKLQAGNSATITPHGNSMQPRIESGDTVALEPVLADTVLAVQDIVLCKVAGRVVLHLITAIGPAGRFTISNNRGHVNGTCGMAQIYGRVTSVRTP